MWGTSGIVVVDQGDVNGLPSLAANLPRVHWGAVLQSDVALGSDLRQRLPLVPAQYHAAFRAHLLRWVFVGFHLLLLSLSKLQQYRQLRHRRGVEVWDFPVCWGIGLGIGTCSMPYHFP